MPVERAPEDLPQIASTHGLCLIVLFGSRARATGRATSDLDLGVLHKTGKRLSHRALAELTLALSEASHAPVDAVDLAVADALVRFEIARDGVVWHCEPAATWPTFVARTLIEHDDLAYHLPKLLAGIGRAARRGVAR